METPSKPLQIGVVYPQIELGGDPAAVRRIGTGVEDLGFDFLLAYDHVLGAVHAGRTPALLGPYTERDPFHDPLVMFAYLAGITTRIGFATGVLVLPQRQTALVARQAADVDLLSGGRLRLGVGVGWNYVEYEALGEDFRTRGAREEEQIRLLHQLFTEPVVDFAGRLGDGFIFFGGGSRTIDAWKRLRDRVSELGRPVENFGADYVALPQDGGLSALAAEVDAWRAAGGTHVSVASLGLGLDSADAHLEYLSSVADALGVS